MIISAISGKEQRTACMVMHWDSGCTSTTGDLGTWGLGVLGAPRDRPLICGSWTMRNLIQKPPSLQINHTNNKRSYSIGLIVDLNRNYGFCIKFSYRNNVQNNIWMQPFIKWSQIE